LKIFATKYNNCVNHAPFLRYIDPATSEQRETHRELFHDVNVTK